jgi:predicted MFS family arabinose efflux permease
MTNILQLRLYGPLAVRNFRLLSAGQFSSTVGDYCYAIALPWYVLSSHGTTLLLGFILACYGIPRTVLIPVGGLLADRLTPRVVALIADAARCVLVALLGLLASRHTVPVATLGPTAALIGAGEGLFIPASFALLPSVLDSEQLTAGNGVFSALQWTGALIGPAAGAAVVTAVTPAAAFGIDAASFAVSALTLTAMRPPATARAGTSAAAGPTAGPTAGSTDGSTAGGVVRLLRTSRLLRVILMIVVAANLTLGGLIEVAVPALAHERFGASGLGALLVCMAAGSVAGSLMAARTSELSRPALAVSVAYLVEAVAVSLVPFLGGLRGAAAAMAVIGLSIGLCNGIVLPRLQAWAPPALIGRVMGLILVCSIGSTPLSVALTGLLVDHCGAAVFFPVAGAVGAAVFLAALTSREWRGFR